MVEERPLPRTLVAQKIMMESARKTLMDDETWIMGMYDMGGVGKTALLAQIYDKLYEERQIFDLVIWVDVSRDVHIEKIQEDIAEKLAIYTHFLKEKEILVIIGRRVEESGYNRDRIVFTTRSREICGHMGVYDPMEVQYLAENDAWELFQRKVGQKTLLSHPDISMLARKIAKKCHGLPLALNVIGETMSCKTSVYEWKHAIDRIFKNGRVYSPCSLLYSYDILKGEHVKSCFQYCVLFPEDHKIRKEELIEYWICEGFVDGKDGRERALNQGYEILGTLLRAGLLLEDAKTKSYVKMHDVVREMAILEITRRDVLYKVELSYANMSLMRTNIKMISGNPDCPQLTTLLLKTNYKLENISGEFFMSMPMLVVLDLSMNYRLEELPEEISELVSLQFLDLSYTSIDRLSVGIQKLKKLLHLNMESMWRLESIYGISNLSSLRLLKLRNSTVLVDNSLIEELQLLEYLETLTLTIPSSLGLKKLFSAHKLVKCIQKVPIKNLEEKTFKILSFPVMDNLNSLAIWKCDMLEIKIEKSPSWNKSPTSSCFSNLSYIWIRECSGLRDLTWLLFAPNLIDLTVGSINELEDIISKEKADQAREEQGNIIPFQKLESLSLIDLPTLKSIYWSPLPFPSLKRIKVQKCRKLRRLPFDSKSGVVGEDLVINYGEEEWIERVKWEDEATRLRFLSSSYKTHKEMTKLSSSAGTCGIKDF
ncbi:unnamed protein product [Arabidopsis lyrata]|nr:unnamed protein product [Arabidopsis lyrata]